MKTLQIPVGAPEARLIAIEIPPGNYHVRITSRAEANASGTGLASFECIPTNHNSMVPLPEKGTIVLLHDYARQKEFMVPWGMFLAQAGYRVVVVDLRGHGASTGQIISYGKYETADLSQMLDYLKKQGIGKGKVGVLGVGYGGQLALQWAARDPRVGAIVAIAPYARLESVFEIMAEHMKTPIAPKTLHKAIDGAAERLDIKWADWSGEAAVRRLKQPVLFIGSDKDVLVKPDDLTILGQAAPPGSSTLKVIGISHRGIPYLFHEIGEPIKTWFVEHSAG